MNNGSQKTSETTDMTNGRIRPLMVHFFLPILLGNFFQQAYSMVDIVVVGRGLGEDALASVGNCSAIQFCIMGFMIGLTGGFGILIAQSFGAKNIQGLRRITAMSVVVAFAIGAITTILSLLLIRKYFVFMQTPKEILSGSLAYFRIVLGGIIITIGNNFALTILRALGDGRTPLRAMCISSIVNIILDILFIMIFHLGVAFAAVATVVAQLFSFFYCFGKIRKISVLQMESENWFLRWNIIKKLCIKGLPVACMNSVTALGGITLQYFVNRMGSRFVAAYAACSKITGLSQQPGQAVGMTVLTFTGQNLGARKIHRIRQGIHQGVLLSILVNLPIGILLIFFPAALTNLIIPDKEIIMLCIPYLRIAGVCIFGLGFLFVFRSACQGLLYTLIPMFSGVLEVFLRVGVILLLAKSPNFSKVAVAEVSAWLSAWLLLMGSYYKLIKKEQNNIR